MKIKFMIIIYADNYFSKYTKNCLGNNLSVTLVIINVIGVVIQHQKRKEQSLVL